MTIGFTWRRTARRIKRLKEGVLTISPDYSDRPTPDFLALSVDDGLGAFGPARFCGPWGAAHQGAFGRRWYECATLLTGLDSDHLGYNNETHYEATSRVA